MRSDYRNWWLLYDEMLVCITHHTSIFYGIFWRHGLFHLTIAWWYMTCMHMHRKHIYIYIYYAPCKQRLLSSNQGPFCWRQSLWAFCPRGQGQCQQGPTAILIYCNTSMVVRKLEKWRVADFLKFICAANHAMIEVLHTKWQKSSFIRTDHCGKEEMLMMIMMMRQLMIVVTC